MEKQYEGVEQRFTRCYQKYGERSVLVLLGFYRGQYHKFLLSTFFFVVKHSPALFSSLLIANVIEEIADVQIMLDQLRLIFARNTDEVEEDKLRRLLGRLNSYAESNLHEWLNRVHDPQKVWSRTAVTGTQSREGGAPDE